MNFNGEKRFWRFNIYIVEQARAEETEVLHKMKSERREKLIRVLNKYSLMFHIILACGICFVIEWVSQHSFLAACEFMFDRNLVFLFNSMIIYASLLLVYLFRRRAVLRVLVSVFWLVLGIINGCVLTKRVTPFGFTDIKMLGDLFTMHSNYFTITEAVMVIIAMIAVIIGLVYLWIKGPKFEGKLHRMIGAAAMLGVVAMFPQMTDAAVENNILTSYFENLAQGYKDYGFVYSFSASMLDCGMSAPEGYSEDAIEAVLDKGQEKDETENFSRAVSAENSVSFHSQKAVKTTSPELNKESVEEEIPKDVEKTDWQYPNIICVLLESFIDPGHIRFLETSEDPIPNFHALYDGFTSGYLEVPVVGAGTANTEFEILTGMGMQFFGLGEYPYKTILMEVPCESIAGNLKKLGYGAHAVHNNGGTFYSRSKIFSQLGFDTFTSKELMDITEYTPLGTWPVDDVLIEEVEHSLDYTPDQPDFIYTITVEAHGDYPEEQVLKNPKIGVKGPEDEGRRYAWEYYVNQLHEADDFIGELIHMLSQREEPTFVVMFGDHLPTMDLTEEDMITGSLFQTQYVTWNNLGLEKKDKNMSAYQLLADMTEDLDIHMGTMFTFHQNRSSYLTEEEYQAGMELIQYDLLYGEQYAYDGQDLYPASDLIMGTQEVRLEEVMETKEYYYLAGDNFTKWSKVFVNGEKVDTEYKSKSLLRIEKDKIQEGENTLVVNQMGSSSIIFRSSNEFSFTRIPEE